MRKGELICLTVIIAALSIIGCFIALSVYSLTHPTPRVVAKRSRAYLPNDVAHNGAVPAVGPDQAATLLTLSSHVKLVSLKQMDLHSRADLISYLPVSDRVLTLRLFYTSEKAKILDMMPRKIAVETILKMGLHERKAVLEVMQANGSSRGLVMDLARAIRKKRRV